MISGWVKGVDLGDRYRVFGKKLLKSIHWVNSFARSSFFEKHIILTKPFQPARADISCSFFEKHIIVQNFLLSEWALTLAIWLSIPGGGHRCLSGQDGVIFNHKNPGRVPFGKGICRQLCLLTPPSAIYGTGKEILSVNFRTPKVQLCIMWNNCKASPDVADNF